jgi:hypothetical protein
MIVWRLINFDGSGNMRGERRQGLDDATVEVGCQSDARKSTLRESRQGVIAL